MLCETLEHIGLAIRGQKREKEGMRMDTYQQNEAIDVGTLERGR
jgi:hypothetical protein